MLQINLIGLCVRLVLEVHGTENPPTRRPLINTWFWQETAINNHAKDRLGRMKSTNNQLEDSRTQKGTQVRTRHILVSVCAHVLRQCNPRFQRFPPQYTAQENTPQGGTQQQVIKLKPDPLHQTSENGPFDRTRPSFWSESSSGSCRQLHRLVAACSEMQSHALADLFETRLK